MFEPQEEMMQAWEEGVILQEGSPLPFLSDQPLTSILVNDMPALMSSPSVLSDTLAVLFSWHLPPSASFIYTLAYFLCFHIQLNLNKIG